MKDKPQHPDDPEARSGIGLLRKPVQWLVLFVLSAPLAVFFEIAGIPAGLMMGPMFAGVVVAINGGTIRLPRVCFFGVQVVLAMMIAGMVSPNLIDTFLSRWPIFLAIVLSVIAMSTLSGWVIARMGILPGTTAIWGSSAGAASTMLVMGGAYGADIRLVAFMQYLRVVFVATLATLIGHFGGHQAMAERLPFFGPFDLQAFALTLGIGVGAGILGRLLRIPAGSFLTPFGIGALLSLTGTIHVELPPWLLASAFALLGWSIGLGFTRSILRHARRAFVPTVVSIVVLLAFSGLLAYLLVIWLGIDPMTAYLATSPGGLDSIAVIAASSNVDLSFVMALQTARLVIITLIGPLIARFVADRT
ncbi:AbrB family transcriptional regulator [Rhizobium sp. TRM96647]|uniref:AbrB family transcriptional regulator n=1 Tax=unclassified Rhizobium TaxID=2613769 RepID=UPI0039916154